MNAVEDMLFSITVFILQTSFRLRRTSLAAPMIGVDAPCDHSFMGSPKTAG